MRSASAESYARDTGRVHGGKLSRLYENAYPILGSAIIFTTYISKIIRRE
jgi:hypothetical protein